MILSPTAPLMGCSEKSLFSSSRGRSADLSKQLLHLKLKGWTRANLATFSCCIFMSRSLQTSTLGSNIAIQCIELNRFGYTSIRANLGLTNCYSYLYFCVDHPRYREIQWSALGATVVNCPTRWSLIFLCWSSQIQKNIVQRIGCHCGTLPQ